MIKKVNIRIEFEVDVPDSEIVSDTNLNYLVGHYTSRTLDKMCKEHDLEFSSACTRIDIKNLKESW